MWTKDVGRAYIIGPKVGRAYISGPKVGGAYISGPKIGKAYISGPKVGRAYISGPKFGRAYISGPKVGRAYISGPKFGRSYISGPKMLLTATRVAVVAAKCFAYFMLRELPHNTVFTDVIFCEIPIPCLGSRIYKSAFLTVVRHLL